MTDRYVNRWMTDRQVSELSQIRSLVSEIVSE